ncbi:flagellar hook-basal body protein FliE [Fictibacillus macauensis ZFHKF-1]|uniref:Flagellar hook-basal body complex protein FliE n=1 Tax=Fictibacillus macauensis ZFHKF-1 TaxID=1196324 RepID=I8AI04_9BACL|nr:flagellar hook-basal body complex protein FliE [Fictibacillus macauensis]EIT85079.1 flagellar hook-basal body protein FliE [Fictibacillus macauensis ZFHKF-1]
MTMSVQGVTNVASIPLTENIQQVKESEGSFATVLQNMLQETNGYEQASNQATNQLLTGKTDDISSVMVLAEKANLTLQTAVEVRNKVLEAYQEIMRTQL